MKSEIARLLPKVSAGTPPITTEPYTGSNTSIVISLRALRLHLQWRGKNAVSTMCRNSSGEIAIFKFRVLRFVAILNPIFCQRNAYEPRSSGAPIAPAFKGGSYVHAA